MKSNYRVQNGCWNCDHGLVLFDYARCLAVPQELMAKVHACGLCSAWTPKMLFDKPVKTVKKP